VRLRCSAACRGALRESIAVTRGRRSVTVRLAGQRFARASAGVVAVHGRLGRAALRRLARTRSPRVRLRADWTSGTASGIARAAVVARLR
jgi:hypothetical protein